jgi:tetratricopeptide (TPR) repeat protein
MKKSLLLACAMFSLVMTMHAQKLNDAFQLLHENKREQAMTALKQISSGSDAADALLAQCFQNLSDEHYPAATENFLAFYKIAPNPYPYIYALWNTGVFSMSRKETEKSMKKLMEDLTVDPKANSTIKAMAWSNLANLAQSKGDVRSAKDLYKKQHDLRNWSILGVFENTSASGFNKEYGVLANPKPNSTFKNKTGATIKWFNVIDSRNDRWFDFEYHLDISNGIMYAQTFMQSDADKDVVMLVGVSGSMKIWINDFLIAAESEERNTDKDVYNYEVKLKAGYNRILVQIGESEINNANFMIRFMDKEGNTLQNLNSTQENQPYTKAQAYTVKKVPLFAEAYFEDRLAKNPNSFLDMMVLSRLYLRNDKNFEARKIAAQLKKQCPKSTLVSEIYIEANNSDKNSTDVKKEYEFIKTNDPESLYGFILRQSEATEKEDYDEALKLLKQREVLFGKNAGTEISRIVLLSKKKDNEQVIKLIIDGAQKYPDNETYLAFSNNILEAQKDKKGSINLTKSFLERNYSFGMMSQLVGLYLDNGQKNEAFKLYNKMIEDFPYSTGTYNTIADKYYDLQDYSKALEWQEKALTLAPYLGSFHYSKGVILESLKNSTEAKNSFRNSIMYNPTNYNARKKLREMDGKKDLFSYFKEIDPYDLMKKSPNASDYTNDNSVYLLNEQQQVVYPENGASEERYKILVKVFNQAGIDYWKDISLGYNSYSQRFNIEKAETIKKDGSKIKAEIDDDRCVFTNLEAGDAVYVAYRVENYYGGKLAEHFWEDFNFNSYTPMKIAKYSLIVPNSKVFKYKMMNGTIEPAITPIDEYKMYVWEKQNSPAIQSEDFMPPFDDIAERVVVSSIPDWNYVANWYRDLASVKTKADFEVKETVKEVFGDKKNLTEIQKAKMIYEYICKNYSYSNVSFLQSAYTPKRASKTITTKLGDCKDLSTLFVSMAKEVGLNAFLVLVDTRDNGDNPMPLPYIGFNHCIAGLNTTDGKKYLLELTDNKNPFGGMSYKLLNSNGLYIPKDEETATTADLQKLNYPNRTPNAIDRVCNLSFEGNNINVERSYKRTAAEASSIRNNEADKGEEDKKKDMTSSLSSEFNKKIQLKEMVFSNLTNLSDTITLRYKFSVENATTELMGMQILKLPWNDQYNTTNFVSLEKRVYPFNVWNFSSTPYDKEVMTIMFPKGKKLAEIPKNVTVTCGALDYKVTYVVKPDRLIATREMKYNKDVISTSEYDAFKNFISKVSEADSKPIGFR